MSSTCLLMAARGCQRFGTGCMCMPAAAHSNCTEAVNSQRRTHHVHIFWMHSLSCSKQEGQVRRRTGPKSAIRNGGGLYRVGRSLLLVAAVVLRTWEAQLKFNLNLALTAQLCYRICLIHTSIDLPAVAAGLAPGCPVCCNSCCWGCSSAAVAGGGTCG